VEYQTAKYARANILKKGLIKADVRSKLKASTFNLAFIDRMIDGVFIHKLMYFEPEKSSSSNMQEEERKDE